MANEPNPDAARRSDRQGPATFVFQKISNHGTSNPIVARLGIQPSELVRWLEAPEESQRLVVGICLDLQRRLLQCFDIVSRLEERGAAAISDADESIAQGPRVQSLPYLIGLQEEAETFLAASKRYLDEVAHLFGVLFRADVAADAKIFGSPKGGQSTVGVWAEKELGADHNLTRMLVAEASWVEELIRKRNAVEHPRGWSGTLHIYNFAAVEGGIAPPSWERKEDGKDNPRTELMRDLDIYLINLLTLAEDLLAQAVMARPAFPRMTVAEISEDERRPECPVRFTIAIPGFGRMVP